MKRIVICADGTWNQRDQLDEKTGKRRPTNGTKLARAVLPQARDGVHQVVFYHEGVGTGPGMDKLTGGAFGWEASSFLDAAGPPPRVGHLLLAIDPGSTSGGSFGARMAELAAAFAAEPVARVPGTRRLENRARAAREGLAIDAALHAEIRALIDQPA